MPLPPSVFRFPSARRQHVSVTRMRGFPCHNQQSARSRICGGKDLANRRRALEALPVH